MIAGKKRKVLKIRTLSGLVLDDRNPKAREGEIERGNKKMPWAFW